jgi:hypothetical protein
MEDAFIVFDTAVGLLVAASLAMAVFTHRELQVARLLLVLGSAVLSARWVFWSMVIEHPWWLRALVGAIVGAIILAGVPAFWKWSKERESMVGPDSPLSATNPKPIDPLLARQSALRRHYDEDDRKRLNAVLYELHELLNESVMPAQVEIHELLGQLPQRVHSTGSKPIEAKLYEFKTVFVDARNDYIRRFKSGSHYYADEIDDVTSNKDELMAEIMALDKYIAALHALPEQPSENLLNLTEPYKATLRAANSDLGSWVSLCNQHIKAKRDALQ